MEPDPPAARRTLVETPRADLSVEAERTGTVVSDLPVSIDRARSLNRAWAIRLQCLRDTIERYEAVRERSDRLPAHSLLCELARDVHQLANEGVLGVQSDWSTIAADLETACADPLGEEPTEAIAAVIHVVAKRCGEQ